MQPAGSSDNVLDIFIRFCTNLFNAVRLSSRFEPHWLKGIDCQLDFRVLLCLRVSTLWGTGASGAPDYPQ